MHWKSQYYRQCKRQQGCPIVFAVHCQWLWLAFGTPKRQWCSYPNSAELETARVGTERGWLVFVFANRATHVEDLFSINQRFNVFYQTMVDHVDFTCEVPCVIRYDETCQGAQMDRGCLRCGIVLTCVVARNGDQCSRLACAC